MEKIEGDVGAGICAGGQIHCPWIVVSESGLHPSKVRNPPLGHYDNFSVDDRVSCPDLSRSATDFRVGSSDVSKIPVLKLESPLFQKQERSEPVPFDFEKMILGIERLSSLRHHRLDWTLLEERHRFSCALMLALRASIRFLVGFIPGTRSSTISSLPFIFASTSFIRFSWYLSRYSLKLKGFFIILMSCPASSSSSFSTSGGFFSSGKSLGVRTSSV